MGARPGTNNGGGPKTPEGKARARANLNPQAGVRHGLYCKPRAPRCDTCPGAGDCSGYTPGGTCNPADVQAALVAEVMALPHIREGDRPQVEQYAALSLRQAMPWLWRADYAHRPPRGLDRLRRELGLTRRGLREREQRER